MKKLLLSLLGFANISIAFAANYYDITIINNTNTSIHHNGGRERFDNGGDFELNGNYALHSINLYHMHDTWGFWANQQDSHQSDWNKIWTNIDLPSNDGNIHTTQLRIDNPQFGRSAIYLGYSHRVYPCDDSENSYYEFPANEDNRAATLIINSPDAQHKDYWVQFKAGRQGQDNLFKSEFIVSELNGLSSECSSHERPIT